MLKEFRSQVTVPPHIENTQLAECSTWTTKVVGKYVNDPKVRCVSKRYRLADCLAVR